VQWSSEDPRYGGFGTPPIEGDTGWHLPGESAIVMGPVRDSETDG
jgi:maltooligosyltrehalose trehalohydrolase